jgi:hypothetical protein
MTMSLTEVISLTFVASVIWSTSHVVTDSWTVVDGEATRVAVTTITDIASYTMVESFLISVMMTEIEYPVWLTEYIYRTLPTQIGEGVSSQGLSLKSVICIIIGTVVAVVCLVVAGFLFWRRKMMEKQRLAEAACGWVVTEEGSQEGGGGGNPVEESNDPFQDEWTCDPLDIRSRVWEIIGDGGNLQGI